MVDHDQIRTRAQRMNVADVKTAASMTTCQSDDQTRGRNERAVGNRTPQCAA